MAPGETMTLVTERLMVQSVTGCPRGPEVGRAQLDRLAMSLGIPHTRPDGAPQSLGWVARTCAEVIRKRSRIWAIGRRRDG